MKVLVVSSSVIIRAGVKQILVEDEITKNTYDDIDISNINEINPDLVIIDVKKNNLRELNNLNKIKEKNNFKILVLDFNEDKSLFYKCMDDDVEGYILANIDSEYITRAVKQIIKNRKYFDYDLIEKYNLDYKYLGKTNLTERQIEIITLVGSGKSNKEIAKELFISEHTVKKHVSNILEKLELKDRVNIAKYAIQNGLL